MADSGFTWEQADDRIVIRAPGARITFVRIGDRWTHHLSIGTKPGVDDAATELVSVIESDAKHDDSTRIVSPVYQEIQRHEFAGDQLRGLCVLLTGHLFQHHFSAAVSVLRDPEKTDFVVLEIDVADRCRAPVSALAATYLVRLGSSVLTGASPRAIAWSEPGSLELSCEPPATLAMAEAGRQATRVQALATIDPLLFTHRLRYRWRWASSPDASR
jgi:hypothetical protein